MELSEYREYIEAWVHEIKTPLSLLTLVCNNHRDEISPYVYARMNYIQHQLNEDVERILYYARLQAEHSDIKFTHFRLDECVGEALSEYRPFINEKKILLTEELFSFEIASDRKIVLFILSQLFSNAVKYSDSITGRISIAMRQTDDKIYLAIHNNGKGVPTEDAPFVFDKGFTGNYPNRQKATGMGLYLVRKYAEKLCIEVHLTSRLPFHIIITNVQRGCRPFAIVYDYSLNRILSIREFFLTDRESPAARRTCISRSTTDITIAAVSG